ncbi:hypothetical protein [Treponema phagedenis]|nr:hypothetical protein [Treponema phagedenis]EFW39053.1 hypothetical protein HMPREF9554_00445 [Treponema phagedenis F0421]
MVTQEKEFIPNPENRAIYDGLFEVYKKIYPSLKNIYNGLQRVTNYPEAKKLNS